jgi:hypothetical protein
VVRCRRIDQQRDLNRERYFQPESLDLRDAGDLHGESGAQGVVEQLPGKIGIFRVFQSDKK